MVVTGRIGSGKSTLIKTLLGLLQPLSGLIQWNGTPVDPSAAFVPPLTAYTPQVPTLFSETARDNLLLGLRAGQPTLDASIRQAVLEDDVESLPEKLDTLIGAKGVRLSGGQRQRLAAARMLVRDPELMVFDDLSSALDIDTENELWRRLLTHKTRTYLVVSHRRFVLQKADRIIVLKGGMVDAAGTHPKLLEESSEYRMIWGEPGASNDGLC